MADKNYYKNSHFENGGSMNASKSLVRLDPTLLSDEAHELKCFLESNIIDQKMGIDRLVDAFSLSLSPLRLLQKPIFAGIFLGPSGVGKTKTAEMLAKFLLGQEQAVTKIACAEYTEPHQISRLFGSPPGYVGFDDKRNGRERNMPILCQEKIDEAGIDSVVYKITTTDTEIKKMQEQLEKIGDQIERNIRARERAGSNPGMVANANRTLEALEDQQESLMSQIRARMQIVGRGMPAYSIILFDEVEKAHPKILDALLEITDKAQATMGNGDKTSFVDSFIIMTSNIGSVEIASTLAGKHSPGFLSPQGGSVYEIAMEELKNICVQNLSGGLRKTSLSLTSLARQA